MEMSIRFPNLNLGFDYVPRSFQIFGFEITMYGILIAVGMLLGISFVVLEAKRSNQDQDKYLNMMIVSLAAAVIGARLFYVGFSWNLYESDPMDIFNIRSGGVAFYGGLLGGVLAAAAFCRICKLSFWQMADTACLGLLIGQIIGRWGNFFGRESFGEYTDGIFAMQLPIASVRSGEVTALMRENLITEGGVSYIQVSPAFLYESLWCLLLFLILLAVRRRKKFQGEVFMLYLAGYGLGRFFLEWIRTDQLLIPGTKVGVGLIISVGLFLFFAPAAWVRRTMSRKRAAARKRRRERFYEAEELAYREEAARQETSKENVSQTESEESAAEEKEKEFSLQAENVQEPSPMLEREETEAESEHWENSEYAHIADTWINPENEENRERFPDSAQENETE